MSVRFKVKILQRLFKNEEFFFVFAHCSGGNDVVGGTIGTTKHKFVKEVLYEALKDNEVFRKFILDATLRYLKRYEVDGKHFVEEILSND